MYSNRNAAEDHNTMIVMFSQYRLRYNNVLKLQSCSKLDNEHELLVVW